MGAAQKNSVPPQGVTELLLQWRGGDASALERLMPIVYADLRRIAGRCLQNERAEHTLQATALVNETYLRLVASSRVQWRDRVHFFAVAAQLMRRVLVDEARRRRNQKRGGAMTRVAIDEAFAAAGEPTIDIIAVDEALERLAGYSQRKARIVELRFFGGLTIEETAEALEISVDIVKREWRTAKAWLARDLGGAADGSRAVESH